MTEPTTQFNTAIKTLLQEHGVEFTVYGTDELILIDRTSMVQRFKCGDEHDCYDACKDLIEDTLKPIAKPLHIYVMWGGRTDDWLGIQVYTVAP